MEQTTITKDGVTLIMIAGPFPGILQAPHRQINPCGHAFPTMLCGCKLHDRLCMVCKRSWVQLGDAFYEVEDPHGRKSQGVNNKATVAATTAAQPVGAPRRSRRGASRGPSKTK